MRKTKKCSDVCCINNNRTMEGVCDDCKQIQDNQDEKDFPKTTATKQDIDDAIERFTMLSKGIGHESWWYSNRTSKDCINVKIYDKQKGDVKELLSESEKKAIELLDINVDEFVSKEWYSQLEFARDNLNDDRKYNDYYPHVLGFEFIGHQGGWLCVQYDFTSYVERLEDIKNSEKFTKKLQIEAYEIIKSTEAIVTETEKKIIEQIGRAS